MMENKRPSQPHPHGSIVEQIHRVWTTDQGVDAWTLAEETVNFVRQRMVNMIDPAMTGQEVKRAVLDLLSTTENGPSQQEN